jgi:hypothetical protein
VNSTTFMRCRSCRLARFAFVFISDYLANLLANRQTIFENPANTGQISLCPEDS